MTERNDFTFHATCDGKIKIRTGQIARKAAKRRKHRVAYLCSYCDYWHVGTEVKLNKQMKVVS